ncbi:MAG: hypothetical protein QGI09_08335 [Dehalococcoidia bacterium]|jgi:hypothetical protein|nr:hypothetical protein [Dehalococcoidia bacterium]
MSQVNEYVLNFPHVTPLPRKVELPPEYIEIERHKTWVMVATVKPVDAVRDDFPDFVIARRGKD